MAYVIMHFFFGVSKWASNHFSQLTLSEVTLRYNLIQEHASN
jgi:hypothetical protein